MKTILILAHFSEGVCGVWQRAKVEAVELAKKGYNVHVFSSNAVKGTNEIAKPEENYYGVKIKRFPYRKLGGESYMVWNFEKHALKLNPDIIIAHNYRQPHTEKALNIRDSIRKTKPCKTFLVTHAPFNIKRPLLATLFVAYKDLFNKLNHFDKVITISKWEIPILRKLGCKKEKIIHIPNSIPDEFFSQEKSKEQKKLLYFGRIHPRKDIATLMKAFKNSNLENKYELEITGIKEKEYYEKIKQLQNKLKINISFNEPIYDLNEKINKIDSAEIIVLPSLFEPFGIVFIEAMARGKIMIGSNTKGANEIMENNKTGFIFPIRDYKSLRNLLNKTTSKDFQKEKKKIQKDAIGEAKKYRISEVIKQLEGLF